MNFTYTHHKVEGADGIIDQCIIRTDEDGNQAFIPLDESNSDYQAYLNKDKPQVEHLTEIPTPDEA